MEMLAIYRKRFQPFVNSGLITKKVKESGQRARPETEQLKPAAIVKLENNSLNITLIGSSIHRL